MNDENTKEERLDDYINQLSDLTDEEIKLRNLYLKKLADGTMQGPPTGFPEVDKPHLKYYTDEAIVKNIPSISITDYLKECNKGNEDKTFCTYYVKKEMITDAEIKALKESASPLSRKELKKLEKVENGKNFSFVLRKKITFEKLWKEVDRVKAALIANGIGPYDGNGEKQKVGIGLPTMPETDYLFLACIDLGVIPVMMDPRINAERIKYYVKESNCDVVFAIDKFFDTFNSVGKELGMNDKMVMVSGASSFPKVFQAFHKKKNGYQLEDNQITYTEYVSNIKEEDIKKAHDVKGVFDPDDKAVLEFTSGTTSDPKGVWLSNRNIISVAEQEKSAFTGKEPGDVFLNIMPPFLVYGLVCGIVTTTSEQLEQILIPEFKIKDFAEYILRTKPQHIIGVPSHFEQLMDAPEMKNADLSFLKYVIVGGDKCPPALEERINNWLHEHGCEHNIIKGFGMTELSSVVTVNLDDNSNKVGGTGIPFPRNEIRVVNYETRERLGYNETGEIEVSGPSVMLGYLNHPELEDKTFEVDNAGKVWIKTGDKGYIDKDGQLFHEGRYKDTIVRPDGHNVYPTAIVNTITNHPGIKSAAVVGVPPKDTLSGEMPVACIVIDDEYKDQTKQVIKEIDVLSKIILPPRDIALDYIVVPKLPETPNGKIDYGKIQEMAEEYMKAKWLRNDENEDKEIENAPVDQDRIQKLVEICHERVNKGNNTNGEILGDETKIAVK